MRLSQGAAKCGGLPDFRRRAKPGTRRQNACLPALARMMDRGLEMKWPPRHATTGGRLQPHAPPSKMIAASSEICNFGRGAYDTTGLPKPPPPQPQ
ncbi:hypothetical protein J3E68DRAFT_430136 [Trichoderma sp. SZMC 28012]